MVNLISPGIQVTETDNTIVPPSVSTTVGGTVGTFVWGAVNQPRLINSENELVSVFGKPDDETAVSFFTASNFLSYSSSLYVVRMVGTDAANASSSVTQTFSGDGSQTAFNLGFTPVSLNSITVKVGGTIQEPTDDYTLTGAVITFISAPASGTDNITVEEKQIIDNDEVFEALTSLPSSVYAKYPGKLGNSLKVILADSTSYDTLSTSDKALFTAAPENNEIHFGVIDSSGEFTGVAGTLLEKKEFLSKTVGSQSINGEIAYYKEWINRNSRYVYSTGSLSDVSTGSIILSNGVSDNNATDTILQSGYDNFLQKERYNISLIATGGASSVVSTYALQTIASVRKDTVCCISPELDDVLNASGQETTNIIDYRTPLGSSSYGFMDCNWKYQFDVYNDVNRWIPLNGDIAGIIARSDRLTDPWISPAGYNRGVIKNVIKLAWNPTESERDILYNSGINPVITESGRGSVLFGDKTLLTRPSSFDRINVRRLFIVMEKAISEASRFVLFEPNDEFTRASFRNIVTPFLRNIQGSRGISDFRVVADSSNNTSDVINRNEFIADIAVKPIRSINFIRLNFVSTREGVSFEEIGV